VTPPPADESDARHLHHQQPSTTVLNGPNATTHDPPSGGVNFLKGFFLLIFNSDRCYFIELMNLMAFNYYFIYIFYDAKLRSYTAKEFLFAQHIAITWFHFHVV
jgi:hypothetical protein